MAKTKANAAQQGPKRAAIYVRVSGEEQAANGTSLDVQEQACRARAEAEGWTVVQVYVDRGVSGAKKPGPKDGERKALHAALMAAEAGQVDVLLCTKIDRLGRSISVLASLWDRLATADVALVPVLDAMYDDTTAGGRLYRTVMAGLAEMERELIKERTMSGRMARLREGWWAGGPPPLGYDVVRTADGRHPRLVPHPTEAPMLVRAVDLLLSGLTTGQVADALNSEGHAPRRAGRWTSQNLRLALMRANYVTGTWTYGKAASRVSADPVLVTIPALVTEARYEALKVVLRNSSTGERVQAHAHPLSGLIIGSCGHVMTGVHRGDRGRRRYRCRFAKQTKKQESICTAPTYLGEELDAMVWAEVCQALRDPSRLQAAAADYLGVLAHGAAAEADALDKAEAQIVKCQTALSGAFTAGLKAGLGQETLDQVVADLKVDLKAAQDHAHAIRAMQDSTSAQVAGLNQVQALAVSLGDDLENAAPEWQRVVFRALGVQVTVPEFDCHGRPLAVHVSGADVLGLLRAGLDGLAPQPQGLTGPESLQQVRAYKQSVKAAAKARKG